MGKIWVTDGPNKTRTDTYDYTWTEVEAKSQPYPPWFGRLERILSEGPPQPHARASTAPKSGKRQPVEGVSLPPLYEGDQLILGSSRSKYLVTVDGRVQSPGRAIIATRVGLGPHVVEVAGRERKRGALRVQIPLSVLSPIDVRVAPLTSIGVSGEANGGVIDVDLHNRSHGEQLVHVEVDTAPAGWMALRLGRPTYVIKPNRSRRVKVQVERMVEVDDPGELSFGLRISFPSGLARDVIVTFQVAVKESRRGSKRRALSRGRSGARRT